MQTEKNVDEEQAQPEWSHDPCNHETYQLLVSKVIHGTHLAGSLTS